MKLPKKPAATAAVRLGAAVADATPTALPRSPSLCSSPPPPLPVLHPSISMGRASAIIQGASKWLNGTELHYYFFDNPATDFSEVEYANHTRKPQTWVGSQTEQDVVRAAFAEWKALNIGLEFIEVQHREDAEIRIGFMLGDGSWSYIGNETLNFSSSERTMNFGWSLLGADGGATALHEVGHTLGLPHEHQSPFSGIVWNEEAVYSEFSGPPNNWQRDMIYRNILAPISSTLVRGSTWDPDSIMEYEFGPGLIKAPPGYAKHGLKPPGHLSASDIAWVKQFYPAMKKQVPLLTLNQSTPLDLKNGQQADFRIEPQESRSYNIQTFGRSDALLGLFEQEEGKGHGFRSADDDSGEERNALLQVKLLRGHKYVLRVRLKYREATIPPAVMIW